MQLRQKLCEGLCADWFWASEQQATCLFCHIVWSCALWERKRASQRDGEPPTPQSQRPSIPLSLVLRPSACHRGPLTGLHEGGRYHPGQCARQLSGTNTGANWSRLATANWVRGAGVVTRGALNVIRGPVLRWLILCRGALRRHHVQKSRQDKPATTSFYNPFAWISWQNAHPWIRRNGTSTCFKTLPESDNTLVPVRTTERSGQN